LKNHVALEEIKKKIEMKIQNHLQHNNISNFTQFSTDLNRLKELKEIIEVDLQYAVYENTKLKKLNQGNLSYFKNQLNSKSKQNEKSLDEKKKEKK